MLEGYAAGGEGRKPRLGKDFVGFFWKGGYFGCGVLKIRRYGDESRSEIC